MHSPQPRVLLVAATRFELAPLAQWLEALPAPPAELLVTGIGQARTAWQLARRLASRPFDLALNLGIAGSFSPRLPIGQVVAVESDRYADLAIGTPEGPRDLFEMGFLDPDAYPFRAGRLWAAPGRFAHLFEHLPKAHSITVNTTSGSAEAIGRMRSRFDPELETMEGAAFFEVCLEHGLPCAQLRAVSNFVEPRDPSRWDIPLAIRQLDAAARALLAALAP